MLKKYSVRRLKNESFLDSLLNICIKYISANLCVYKNSGYLELFPIHIKDRIIIYVTRILKGFHDDDLLETLLHENLINIDLSGSTISDRTLKSLATYCPNLKKIVMSRARYLFSEQVLISTIPTFTNLNNFQLNNCKEVTDEFLRELALKCPNLDLLDLSGCKQITDESASSLDTLKLTKLNVSNTSITDQFLAKLGLSPVSNYIEDINLSQCNITTNGLRNLRWDKLKYVGFEGCWIDDLEFLNSKKQLKFIQWTISK